MGSQHNLDINTRYPLKTLIVRQDFSVGENDEYDFEVWSGTSKVAVAVSRKPACEAGGL